MNFLYAHWHCILPLAGIVIAVLLMKKHDEKNEKDDR
jgi:hypothetical protein